LSFLKQFVKPTCGDESDECGDLPDAGENMSGSWSSHEDDVGSCKWPPPPLPPLLLLVEKTVGVGVSRLTIKIM
jgi:hypothetical protein